MEPLGLHIYGCDPSVSFCRLHTYCAIKSSVADGLSVTVRQTCGHVGVEIRPDQIWQAGDSITAFAQV